ncbi:MAG: O-antigen ligase family protein [Thermoleophilia bacterium]
MRYVVRALVVCLVAFSAIAIATEPVLTHVVLIWVGSAPVYIFDVLLAACVGLLLYSIGLKRPVPPPNADRLVLRLNAAYVLYQVLVVVPIAVIIYGISVGDAVTSLEGRIGMVLIPFFVFVGLRYVPPRQLVGFVNAAAVLLLVFALYRYATDGPQGYWEGTEYRLRILWGGSVLVFGWLALTGLFLERRGLRAYALSLAGVVGIIIVNHRAGYVALLFALAVQFLASRRSAKRIVVVAVASIVVGIALSSVSPVLREAASYSLRTMFNAQSDSTAQDRVERSRLAWDFIRVHPLGDYTWNRTYYLVDLGDEAFEPHNFVFQALDKQGVVSAGLVFALIVAAARLGWKNRHASRLSAVMLSYLAFYLAFCLFNTNFDAIENIVLFAIPVALLVDADRSLRRREAADIRANAQASLPVLSSGPDGGRQAVAGRTAGS